ncbi:MAG TPA: DUF1698 domain-containing protein [Caulobacteraceae bacterium]|jgi:hypothetical protein|nr:DUF1698 domain-containing protein [Caulobacteraceae bacterium]
MKRPWYAHSVETVRRRLGQAPPRGPAPAFELRAPSVQNAVDLFEGQWATDLSDVLPGIEAGPHRMFTDHRPRQAAERLGTAGRIDGLSVLELGPLEGAHTWQLEQLGAAEVLGVEANATAFLKCLVVKEALGSARSRFMLGDFSEFLRGGGRRFDLIFASGVLYHMADPLDLVALICAASDRCFVWTHYYDPARCPDRTPHAASLGGYEAVYHRRPYDPKGGRFWGGNRDIASWMDRDAILGAFRHFGLDRVEVIEEAPDHVNGPAFTFVARRTGAG